MNGIESASGMAAASDARTFLAAGGHDATRAFLAALEAGRPLDIAELRTNATLRRDEWVAFDNVAVEEGALRLNGIGVLIGKGLVKPLSNPMGHTMYEYEKVSDMKAATQSLDGIARDQNDTQEFSPLQLPLPLTHKDWFLYLRRLAVSRNGGEALDTMNVRSAARRVAEKVESTLFLGGATYHGNTAPGFLTEDNRNQVSWSSGGAWTTGATGAKILADVLKAKSRLEAARFYGPYAILVPAEASGVLDDDFKANGDQTTRERILRVEGVQSVTVCDQLPAGNVVMFQTTEDVACVIQGIPFSTINWDSEGGMRINLKVIAMQVPLIRSTYSGNSGVAHLSASGT